MYELIYCIYIYQVFVIYILWCGVRSLEHCCLILEDQTVRGLLAEFGVNLQSLQDATRLHNHGIRVIYSTL